MLQMSLLDTLTSEMALDLKIIKELYNSKQSVTKVRTVVPWYNPEQFLKVYDYLYSNDIMKQRWAVDQIDVWESRCHPSLPTAIEASQIIIKSVIQDILYINQANICQEKEIQMLYSTALVRFINLTVELHQSYLKQPLSDVAEKLGIPSWIVDLRNEAAHSYLPPLPVLRMGADAALKYLDKSYWSIESKNMKSVIKQPIDIELFKHVVLAYQVKQFTIIVNKNNEKAYLTHMEEMKEILKKVVQCLHKNRKEFIDALCDRGAFITFDRDVKILLSSSEYSKLMNAVENKYGIPPKLPAILETFWYPLLRILNKFGAIPDLVETLLYVQGDRSLKEQWVLGSWVAKILQFSLNPTEDDPSLIFKLFRKQAPLFNWKRLLYAVVANPSPYAPYLFPLINCHLQLDKEFLRPLISLMAIALGQAIEPNVAYNPEHPAFTLADLQKNRKMQEREVRKGKKRKHGKNMWSLASDTIDWETIPVGYVFTSYDNDVGNLSELEWRNLYEKNESGERYLSNKNDIEDMSGIDTVKQDTFKEDEHLISARTFLILSS